MASSEVYIRVHTFDDLFHLVSFRSILFRSIPGFITSPGAAIHNHNTMVDKEVVVGGRDREGGARS